MLLRKLVVVGLVGFFSLAANIATAEDAVDPNSIVGADGVNFADPSDAFSNRFAVSVSGGQPSRFSALAPTPRADSNFRGIELSLVASGGGGFDVSFAQSAGIGVNDNGDIARETRSAEVRLGRGLREMRRDQPSSEPKWYIFAASEDEALIWQPGSRGEFGSSGESGFALQDRVELGDLQAGITYERNGWQASLAYVEREISVRSGARTFTRTTDFTGVTLTMRH